jgi:OOP family OmpA-OmpF porin
MTGLVYAQQSNFYVVGGVGQSTADMQDAAGPTLVTAGAAGVSSTLDKKDTTWALGVGYKFNQNFAVEAAYFDMGKFSNKATGSAGVNTVGVNAEWTGSGIGLSALGILPINADFSVFAKAGVAHTELKVKVDGTRNGVVIATAAAKSREFVPTVGLGAEYSLTKNVAIRAEYDRYFNVGNNETGEADADSITVGVKFSF